MDIKHIKNLVALMVENDLSQLEIQEGETHIVLKRGQPLRVTTVPAVASSGLSAGIPANPAANELAARVDQGPPLPKTTYIRSPMVGTFYAAPDPDSPPFVGVGDIIEPDTVVCVVEAMKVFNEIKAEVSGRLTEVLISNAEAVEYDQPLFAVDPH
jgi:acetyl-CoA carboxylase biotin carboxyl carrier protein